LPNHESPSGDRMIVLLRAHLAASVSRSAMSTAPVVLFPLEQKVEE
jgi:hypothetical protein